jgi:hypothetical protein
MQVTTFTLGGEGAEAGAEAPGGPRKVTHTLEKPRRLYDQEDDTGAPIHLSNGVEVCATRDHLSWRIIRVTAGVGKVAQPAELDIGSLSSGWDGNHNLHLTETREGFLLEDRAHERELHFCLEMGDKDNMEFVVESENQDPGEQVRSQFFRYDASNGKLVQRTARKR